ncbi:hypothetical protein HPB48_011605 [Haemaphysalis longicornis]|uniref:ZSWIM1/3 RNaseH-like domain-containing protein n=1 Tax=Haemaphysalis longicornis TaxID=44386 RepID=A0A9J6GA53_HAELO|nr:hypothetical protein HPB48_011605 [Haemaphysalis longicornis]
MMANNNRGDNTKKLLQMICDLREKEQTTVIPLPTKARSFNFCMCKHAKCTECLKATQRFLFWTQPTEQTSTECPCLFSWSRMVREAAMLWHMLLFPSEQQHVVSKLLETFVKENAKTSDTNVVIAEKDFTEFAAIRETFNSKPSVQLCQFHVMKAFRAAAGQLAHSTEERERLISSFGEMVCAPTPEKFEHAQTDFLRHANAEACAYFHKNWAYIANMWARHQRDKQFTAGNNTTSRV